MIGREKIVWSRFWVYGTMVSESVDYAGATAWENC